MDSSPDPMLEFTSILDSMASLKAPGVTKSKIDAVLKWSMANIKLEQQIVDAVVQHTKTARPTHKLGMIYVVDSITRQWKSWIAKFPSDPSKSVGTFESGVKHMTYYLPELMTMLISEAPRDQKEKISNLVAIWEHSDTFPAAMVKEFKTQLDNFDKIRSNGEGPAVPASQVSEAVSALVGGASAPVVDIQATLASLLPRSQASGEANPATVSQIPDTAKLLASLSQVAPAVTPTPPAPAQAVIPSTESQLTSMLSAVAAAASAPQQPFVPPTGPAASSSYSNYSQPGPPPAAAPANPSSDSSVPAQHLEIFSELWQLLNGTGLSSDKIIEIFTFFHKAMTIAGQSAQAKPPPSLDSHQSYPTDAAYQAGYQRRERSRSRSPPFFDRQPMRRESPIDFSKGHHPISWDDSLLDFRNSSTRQGYIKVLSRTLFVGGVAATEAQLHEMFSQCGEVQSVIVNPEKRHAFVKMYLRAHAEIARAKLGLCPNRPGIEDPSGHGELNLPYFRQTRWAVGFGPRQSMNYDTGISVIDIGVLTPADGYWLISAQFGGTGGRKVEAGMVVEEPDIEIGHGVSSKAISKRIHPQPEPPQSYPSRHGPPPPERSWGPPAPRYKDSPPTHYKEYKEGPSAYGRRPSPPPRPSSPRQEPNNVGVPPAVPGFGFSLPGMGRR